MFKSNKEKQIEDIVNKLIDDQVGLESVNIVIRYSGNDIQILGVQCDKQEWIETGESLIEELKKHGFEYEIWGVGSKSVHLQSIEK